MLVNNLLNQFKETQFEKLLVTTLEKHTDYKPTKPL